MRAEDWTKSEFEIEGWPVEATRYRIGESYITEIGSPSSGATIARGIAKDAEDSLRQACESASRRLLRTRLVDLTIGG